jgi:hypothetical protein
VNDVGSELRLRDQSKAFPSVGQPS